MAVFWICTTFLSRQPVIGPCLLGHQLCGSIHGLSKVALFQYRLILAEKKGICLDDRLAFRAPFVSGDHFLTKFFKCQPVHIARWNKSLKNQDCSVLPLNSVAQVKIDVQMMLFGVQLAPYVRSVLGMQLGTLLGSFQIPAPFFGLEWPTRNVKLSCVTCKVTYWQLVGGWKNPPKNIKVS